MENKPKYPVGIPSFSEIREGNYLYVDKTELVYKLTHDPKYVFLSRPRRFGKSLLVSTLQCYFEGRKELFGGLAMESLEKEWTTFPVLRFDFGGLKVQDASMLTLKLHRMLDTYDRIYGSNAKDTTPGMRFAGLIERAFQQTGQRVVLLIDEYDVPMLQVLQKPDMIEDMRTVLREFYSQIKPSNDYLRFVFITGISTFSQLGMFSELNNLRCISESYDYSTLCGITHQELLDNFQYGIRLLAEKDECAPEEIVQKLTENYDGYHFNDALVGVFNPYSLLNTFNEEKFADYWFKTGTPAFVVDMLKEHKGQWKFDIEKIDRTEPMSLSRFSTPLEQARGPIPFLYQAGYLTIKEYLKKEDLYVLGVPNTEVRLGLIQNLIPLYSTMDPDVTLATAKMLSLALCEGDYNQALRSVQAFLAGIPFMEGDKKILADQQLREAYYHRILYIIFSMVHNGAHAQVRQALGMPDIVVTTSQYIYIIEVKIDSTPAEALRQVEEKNYAAPYITDGREIVKLGVNFSTATRTLSEWKRG
jgi:hypothetical protein